MSEGHGQSAKSSELLRNRYSDEAPAISDSSYRVAVTLTFDLGPMTLTLNDGLDSLKVHLHSENEVAGKAI